MLPVLSDQVGVSAKRKTKKETLAAGPGGKKEILSAHPSHLCLLSIFALCN